MRAQAKAQINAPTEVNTQPVAQNSTPESVKMQNETEKETGHQDIAKQNYPTTSERHCTAPRICITPSCHATRCLATTKASKC